ncbi:MAG TPA: hypothetical protein VFF73_34025 [Planctomycetota bacterium]|nr:hypothetical protein [Planctomycetota bacterium]
MLALVALTFAGCGTFRLSAGYCFGLGASVKVSLVDASFVAGGSVEAGNVYGVTGTQRIAEFGLPLLAHLEEISPQGPPYYLDHLEGLMAVYGELAGWDQPFVLNRPGEVGFGLYLGFVSVHVGFDFEELARLIVGAKKTPFVGTHGSDEHIDSPDPIERIDVNASAETLDEAISHPHALVATEESAHLLNGGANVTGTGHALSPAIALVERFREGSPELVAVAKAEEQRSGEEVRKALADRDLPRLLHLVREAPLAASSRGALETLGELSLERGALDEAVEVFERLTKLGPDATARAKGARLAEVARRLRDAVPAGSEPVSPPAGPRVTAEGKVCRGLTASGDVAWIRSDLLGPVDQFLHASPVATTRELAILDAGYLPSHEEWQSVPHDLIALDASGELRWRTSLPAFGDPVFCAQRAGRLFAVAGHRALAVDLETGRYEWRYKGPALYPEARLPYESPIPEPPALEDVKIRVARGAVEWLHSPGGWRAEQIRRLERVDAGTGRPLPESRRGE